MNKIFNLMLVIVMVAGAGCGGTGYFRHIGSLEELGPTYNGPDDPPPQGSQLTAGLSASRKKGYRYGSGSYQQHDDRYEEQQSSSGNQTLVQGNGNRVEVDNSTTTIRNTTININRPQRKAGGK